MEAALAAKSMMVKIKTHKKKKKNLVGPNMSGTVMDSDALWTDRHPLFLQKDMMKEEHHTVQMKKIRGMMKARSHTP